ncbi:MAG TPA: hypothetical protein VFC39_13465 [Acidobacteriaceae bacterium]|nr:hypothetical protein [Acidobacteriaceae bacterium]
MNFENSQPGIMLPSKRRARAVRIGAAIVAAPVATALLFTLYDAASGTAQVHGFLNAVTNAISLACIIYLFALVTALGGGLPAYFLYRRVGFTSFLSYGLGGAILGALSPITWHFLGSVSSLRELSVLLLYAAGGCVAALLFRSMIGQTLAVRPAHHDLRLPSV